MRYFLLSYTANSNNGFVHGCISFEYHEFPSRSVIRDAVTRSQVNIYADTIVVSSVYEFKNEADFQNFRS